MLTEIVEKRGRFHKAYSNGDGSITHRISPSPMHRLEAGQWIDMDNAVLGPWQFRVDGKIFHISISKLQAKSEGGAVRTLFPIIPSVTARTNISQEAGLAPGISIRFDATPRGIKESIIISSLPNLTLGSFVPKWVTITGSMPGVSASSLMRKPATFQDANGNEGPGYLVWNGDDFELGVDVTWLKAAALPVVIDPTITTEGNDISLQRGVAGVVNWTKMFIKFDIDSIPDTAIISAATLNLYQSGAGDGGSTLYCRRFNSQTWTEADSVASLDAISMGANLDSKLQSAFVTSAFNALNVRKGDSSDGIEADVSGGNQYFTGGLFHTSEIATGSDNSSTLYCGYAAPDYTPSRFNSAEAESNLPYLDVTYTVTTGAGASGVTARIRLAIEDAFTTSKASPSWLFPWALSEDIPPDTNPMTPRFLTSDRFLRPSYMGGFAAAGRIPVIIGPENAHKMLFAVFTNISTANPAAGVYQHTMTAATTQPSLEVQVYNDFFEEWWRGVIVSGMELSVQPRSFLTANLDVLAAQYELLTAGTITSAVFSSLAPFTHVTGSVERDDGVVTDAESFSLRVSTNPLSFQRFGSMWVSDVVYGKQQADWELTFALTNDTEFRRFFGDSTDTSGQSMGDRYQSVKLEWIFTTPEEVATGYNYSLKITAYGAVYRTFPQGIPSDNEIIRATPTAIVRRDPTAGVDIEILLQNSLTNASMTS